MTTRYEEDLRRDEEYGPPMHGGRRRGGAARKAVATLLVVLLILVALPLAVALYASSQIERIPVRGLAQGGGSPMHVLVVGSDSREGLTAEERRELATGQAAGERTDTIFIMTIGDGGTAMLAFPRDLWVTRCDGSQGRINAAGAIDGPGCLVETVTNLSGIPIDHYLQVNFLGFRDIVNAVGGVEVCLERPIADVDAGIDLPAGCQVLDGSDALGYVRVRKVDNDLERIGRQQQFLTALAGEVASPTTVLNPLRLFPAAGAVGSSLTADEGLGIFDLGRMAWGMRGLASSGLPAHTVPTAPQTIGGAAVLLPVESEAQPLFDRFRSGAVLGESGASGPEPADVRVMVLNGVGVDGLAAGAAEVLTDRGFQVVGVANAPARENTVIRYPPGAEEHARLLADQAPTPVSLEEDSAAEAVQLILGADAADFAE